MYNFNGSKRKKTADCTHIVGCYRCNGCYNTGFSADLWVAALEKVIVYVKIQDNAKIILKEEYEEDNKVRNGCNSTFFVWWDSVLIHRQRWQQRRLPLKMEFPSEM